MSANTRLVVVMVLTVTMALPTVAAAQGPAVGLPIAAGQKVRVTSADGRVTSGTVQSVTPTAIEVGNATTRTSIANGDVVRVELEDSVRNGVVKGALIGGLVLGMLGAAAGTADGLAGAIFEGDTSFRKVEETGNAGFALGLVGGAILGFVIDGGKVKTIYERADGGMTLGLRPIVSGAGKGIGVRVTW